MSALPYHKRYHSDALAGMMPLTLEERGAYNTLLDLIYDRGGPLIDNERLLAGYMNCSVRKWRQIRQQLIDAGKIYVNADGLIANSRARKEIENQSKTRRKLVEAGAKGGRVRVEKEKKSNENSESGQAPLKPASSDPQAISEARSQSIESSHSPRSRTPTLPADVRSVMEEAGFISPPSDLGLLREWYAVGATLEHDVLPCIRRVRSRLSKPPFKLKVFDSAVREKLVEDEAQVIHFRRVAERNQATG